MQQHEPSKFLYTTLLKKKRTLSNYIPEFSLYSRDNVKEMLDKHEVIFLKEDTGLGGRGIMRLTKQEDKILVNDAWMRRKNISIDRLPLYSNKRYIVQQGIDVEKYKNCSYDIRVYFQRMQENWEYIGTVAKVSHPGRFVAHSHRKGTPTRIEDILEEKEIKKVNELANKFAEGMLEYFPGLRELGLDFVRDTEGKFWFLEANTIPAFGAFQNTYPKTFMKIKENKNKLESYKEKELMFRYL